MMGWLRGLMGGAPPRAPEPLPAVVIARSPPLLTPESLARAVPLLSLERAQVWCPAILAVVPWAQLGPRKRLAMFLAMTGHESGSFARMVESLDYSPEALHRTWPRRFSPALAQQLGRVPGRAADQEAIAQVVYGGRMGNTQPGDGWRFRGRGPAQLTGRANYEACAAALGMTLDELVARIVEPEPGMRSAAWFWRSRPEIAGAADLGDVEAVTRIWNGGLIGIEDRRARYGMAMEGLEP
jgi:putative chitinase